MEPVQTPTRIIKVDRRKKRELWQPGSRTRTHFIFPHCRGVEMRLLSFPLLLLLLLSTGANSTQDGGGGGGGGEVPILVPPRLVPVLAPFFYSMRRSSQATPALTRPQGTEIRPEGSLEVKLNCSDSGSYKKVAKCVFDCGRRKETKRLRRQLSNLPSGEKEEEEGEEEEEEEVRL